MRPHTKLVKMVALDHIESFAIEMFYQDYEESGGDKKYRFVNLGKVTIDLLHMQLFITDEPENKYEYRDVYRGKSHFRPRYNDKKIENRFSGAITADSLRCYAGQSMCAFNFLGKTWFRYHNKWKSPTLN